MTSQHSRLPVATHMDHGSVDCPKTQEKVFASGHVTGQLVNPSDQS